MTNTIKIGDRVAVLDDNIKGKVIAVTGKLVLLQDQNGFQREYNSDELVKYDNMLNEDQTIISKHPIKKSKKITIKKVRTNLNVVDLHHNQVGLSKHIILESQLRKFKIHLNKAIRNRIGIITFISGVGEGILRNNIESILKKHHINYSDAPYHKYGNGAIEVYLKGIDKTIK